MHYYTPEEFLDMYYHFGDTDDMLSGADIFDAAWKTQSGKQRSLDDFRLFVLGAVFYAGRISGIKAERQRRKNKNAPHFRQWLADLREATNMTVEEAAALLDVNESYYLLIEDGQAARHMDISLAEKIADAFDMDPGYILEMEKELNG